MLSNLYLNEVDRMLERAQEVTRRAALGSRLPISVSSQNADAHRIQTRYLSAVSRYETMINRDLHRTIDLLERLQRRRRGEPPPPTVNVNVSNDDDD